MGFCVVLQNESGEEMETLVDERKILHALLPSPDDESYPMLASVDRYGDTMFNRPQMRLFLKEWERLEERARNPEEQLLLSRIKLIAQRCRDGVHLFVRFVGD
jgi:hypothetical protein